MLHKLLANPVYIGKVRHKGNVYDGEHEAIIDTALFDAVQRQLALGAPVPKGTTMHCDVHLLTGILFDDTGDRMAPTHGKAHGRRYRYYVSGRVRHSPDAVPDSWHIPAAEIEKVVRDYARQLLGDRALVAGWLQEHASADLIQMGLERAVGLAANLSDNASTDHQRTMLKLMFRSITLKPSAIRFEVRAREIVQQLVEGNGQTGKYADPTTSQDNEDLSCASEIVVLDLPITLRRRGTGMRIVIDSPYVQPEPDTSLVDLIARAHVYLDRLTGQSAMNTTSIAATFGVDRADVGHVLPLAFLSPSVLDGILSGKQSASLTPRKLARAELPILWVEQETALR